MDAVVATRAGSHPPLNGVDTRGPVDGPVVMDGGGQGQGRHRAGGSAAVDEFGCALPGEDGIDTPRQVIADRCGEVRDAFLA